MQKLLNKKNGTTLLFDSESDCMCTDGENIITLGKRVVHIKSGETLGFLFVNLKASYLEKSMENTITRYYIFDSQGKAVTHETNEAAIDLEAISNNRKYIVNEDEISDYEWTIVGVTDLDVYNIGYKELIPIMFLIVAITFVLLVLLSIQAVD